MKLVYNRSVKTKRDAPFVILFSIMPIMDSINGFFEYSGINFSVGVFYRMFTLVILFALQAKRMTKKRVFLDLILSFIALLLLLILHVARGADLSTNLYMLFTWILFPTYLMLTINARKCGHIDNNSIRTVFDFYLWAVALSILIPRMLGLGFSTYSSGQGYKAFYHATNGISYLLGIIIIYMVAKIASDFSLLSVLQLVLIIASCFLVGTMVSITSVIIAFIVFVYIFYKDYPRKRWYIIVGVPLLLIISFIVMKHYNNELMQIYNRKMHFYKSGVFDTFLDFISSGRTVIFKTLWEQVEKEGVFRVLIFGQGTGSRVCEMDFLDFLLQYGALGFFVYLFLIKRIMTKHKKWRSIFLVLIVYSLFYAAIVGHVFSSTLSSTLLVLVLCTDSDYKMSRERY